MDPINILLVEDNDGDILLTKIAFEEAGFPIGLNVVKDGMDAIEFMTKQGIYSNTKLPDLLLLDINLPKKSGHEVLKYIKTNDKIKQVPVIMLTTSSAETDINLSYLNHANCYITKPAEANDFSELINTIEKFWLSTVKLPTNKS